MSILVTGGCGFIGSHTVLELLSEGFDVVVIDNLSNSSVEVLSRISETTGLSVAFELGDILDTEFLIGIFQKYDITEVIHLAGVKSVGESVENPISYYKNNVSGSVSLIEVMSQFGCKKLVFSSSATVYGNPDGVPVNENHPLSATSPYGASKLTVENILRDVFLSDSEWSICILRYFNPVGAHESGRIGEDPRGTPNNLLPFVAQVAVGYRDCLKIFGDDYDTLDGTGVRDYIHVVDLSRGHLKALNYLECHTELLTVNLGAGRGYSVLDVVRAFEKVSGRRINYEIVARRPGDVAEIYADPSYALSVLGWKAHFDLEKMCADAWRWQYKNPDGYNEK
jgi:UDP-glucose 4-epimerase